MSIRVKVIEGRDSRTYGFVDLGFGEVEEEEKFKNGTPASATKALVFMLVSLNDGWKCPCAYFLVLKRIRLHWR